MRAAVILLLAIGTTACLTQAGSDEAEDGPPPSSLIETDPGEEAGSSTLRWALPAPEEIVPPLAADRSAVAVVDALFDPLTRLDERGEPRPLAASDWHASRDRSVWTFTLRPGATFHDGTPVTAADVKTSWEAGIRRGRVAPHLEDVRGYEALQDGSATELEGLLVRGRRTLQVLLDTPRADFASVVAHPTLAPVATEAWEADEADYRSHPIGNGPYEMAETWTGGGFIRARHAEPWENGSTRGVDEVLFRFTDVSSGFVAFQQGRVDLAAVPAGGLRVALEQYGEPEEAGPQTGVLRKEQAELYLLGMNVQEPPFDDVVVRRALSFAIDRDAIVQRVPDENATPARGLAPPSVRGAPVSSCTTCLHAPNAAARMFEDRGVEVLDLWINVEGGHRAIAEEIQAALADVGVEVRIRSVPFDVFVEAIESGEAKLFRYGWSAEHPTLDDIVVPLLHSMSSGLAQGNPGGYANAQVDELLDRARQTGDPAARIDLLNQAENLALGREQATVPVMFMRHRLAVGERVDGLAMSPTGRVDLTAVRLTDPQGE